MYYIKYGGREASIYMSEFISMELAGKYGLGYFPESLYFSIPMQKYNDDQKEKNANNQIRRYLPLVFREGEPKNVEINENEELIPLYSFLASPKLTLVAEKMGVTVEEWLLQEYLPKLAHWHARLNFEHGIYIEGHGQNTSAIVNFATGNVVGFVFRDMYDVALDASYRIIKGMEPAVPLKANLSIINSFHVSSRHDRKEEVFTAGELFWEFQMQVVQGILDHPITGKFSQKCVKRFLEEYKSATSQLTGVHIADFNYAKYSYDLKSLVFDSVNTIRDTVVASLKPSIFKYMRVRYKKDILEKILYTSRLVPIFAKYFTLIENGKVDEFKYFFNGTSLAIWSKSEKRPVGYVHSLNDEEKSKLIKLSLGIAL